MARPVQLSLLSNWGGKRRGAGRRNRSGQRAHEARPDFSGKHALHVTARVKPGIPSLRRKDLYQAFRQAVMNARTKGLRCTQFSLMRNHVHLIVESSDKIALSSQMKSFATSFAKSINARAHRRGAVFEDRFHLHVLKTPSETKRALAYVLLNEIKHSRVPQLRLNACSSAAAFSQWLELIGKDWRERIDPVDTERLAHARADVSAILDPPRSWLAARGWQRGRLT